MVFGNPRQCGFCHNYYWQEEAHAKRCHRMKARLEKIKKNKEIAENMTDEQKQCIERGKENFKRMFT